MTAYAQSGAGQYRIRNNALSRYELYQGIDAAPDFTAAPAATSATLPFTYALSVSHVHQICIRRRNAYDLVSQNTEVETYDIGADGTINTVAPSAPENIAITAGAGGTFVITADYNYLEDGDTYKATSWLIYLTTNGSDPNPATDEPVLVSTVETNGIASLVWTSAAAADGATGKVLVRVRRIDSGPTNVDSTNTAILSAVAETDGPSEPGAACQWKVEPAGSWTTIWNSGTDARIDWIHDPGVLRFIVGGVIVGGVSAGRRLLLKGTISEWPYEANTAQATAMAYSGGSLCFGLGGYRCAEIDASGNLRVASFQEEPGYPVALAFTAAIEAHGGNLDFGPDLANLAMRLAQYDSGGGVFNTVLHVKGITENAY